MPGPAQIRAIEAFPVACSLPRAVGDGQGLQPVRQSMFVRVTTENGTYGWGEGGQPVPGVYLVRTRVADALHGLDALATDLVHERAARVRQCLELEALHLRSPVADLEHAEHPLSLIHI